VKASNAANVARYRAAGVQVSVVLREPSAVAAWRVLVAAGKADGRTLADVLGSAIIAAAREILPA